MVRTIDEMTPVDHACAVADSDEHLWEVNDAWLAGGLAAGERVLYFEDETEAAVLGRLADDRVPVRQAIGSGQLLVMPTARTREILSGPAGDLERLLDGHVIEATTRGWPRLRLTGETACALSPSGSADRVMAFE